MDPSKAKSFDYEPDLKRCKEFLEKFGTIVEEDGIHNFVYKYERILREVAERRRRVIEISLDDIIEYQSSWSDLVYSIEKNAVRFNALFCKAVDDILSVTETQIQGEDDVVDILWRHRQLRAEEFAAQRAQEEVQESGVKDPRQAAKQMAAELARNFPEELRRRYELRLLPRSSTKPKIVRDVKAGDIGRLIKIKAIVTRATEVQPRVRVATYSCEECGHELYQEVVGAAFMPISRCLSAVCVANRTSGKLSMQSRGSKFQKFQSLRVQELAEHVPVGHIPRTISVHLTGELTRTCTPGEIVTISGIFLPLNAGGGFRGHGGAMLSDTFIDATSMVRFKKSYTSYDVSSVDQETILSLAAQGEKAYSSLAGSIAPEIFGHTDVKKALLLLMVGGSERKLPGGMKIRGDINVCLMGDPGVAKSQLLKHISTVAPRGVYTSGKGSSGVGLTAAVLRDPVTGDLVLEGGSLVLADKGICCIDEFDKMEDSDRTAIHEVMEQQTISIAKAGITTTLNARTSILAAANPAFGRSPSENINLPAALLSRFDLMFVLLDKPDLEYDTALAEHVSFVHRNGHHPPLEIEVFSPEFLRTYISQARKFMPVVPRGLTEYIVSAYTNMRRVESESSVEFSYTTARTLLGILRLSTALARIRFDEEVRESDVSEALRLMHASKSSLYEQEKNKGNRVDVTGDIYGIIRIMAQPNPRAPIMYEQILPKVVAKGYTQQQLDTCLDDYERLDVWRVSNNRMEIRINDS
ncbi:hypothetical protein PROFUN_08965 [Planoprotostelium fungivorum]|uniref:DNA replication licensing factor MCM7 n=1 Tax=Planoprotostelium fungivorum TaxID=1890364 RepID=A0A2P6NIK0_9EUKA|nr:hypothetical protein PROFUN_08965 [Planoprotostelium fungivorum]